MLYVSTVVAAELGEGADKAIETLQAAIQKHPQDGELRYSAARAFSLAASKLLDLYRNDPDGGIHGAAEWALRQWTQQEKLKELDAELTKVKGPGDRRWFVNSQGQTFAMIEGPVEFRMGSPPTETGRFEDEAPKHMRIPRRFAIAAKEVVVEQFQRFLKLADITIERYENPAGYLTKFSSDPKGPWIGSEWYTAAHYCNWLSEQEGLPTDQYCYLPNEAGAYAEGMSIPADVLKRTGYRLSTEAEWEYACRAGAVTSRFYGNSIDLLAAYARYQANSKEHAWLCGVLFPNDLGLFDTLGNAYEWCQERVNASKLLKKGIYNDYTNVFESIGEKHPRLLRGASFFRLPAGVRSAAHNWKAPSDRSTINGFRPPGVTTDNAGTPRTVPKARAIDRRPVGSSVESQITRGSLGEVIQKLPESPNLLAAIRMSPLLQRRGLGWAEVCKRQLQHTKTKTKDKAKDKGDILIARRCLGSLGRLSIE